MTTLKASVGSLDERNSWCYSPTTAQDDPYLPARGVSPCFRRKQVEPHYAPEWQHEAPHRSQTSQSRPFYAAYILDPTSDELFLLNINTDADGKSNDRPAAQSPSLLPPSLLPLNKPVATLTLFSDSRRTREPLAFKIKTTKPRRYRIQPSQGILLPNEIRKVFIFVSTDLERLSILRQQQEIRPTATRLEDDRFLIQSAAVPARFQEYVPALVRDLVEVDEGERHDDSTEEQDEADSVGGVLTVATSPSVEHDDELEHRRRQHMKRRQQMSALLALVWKDLFHVQFGVPPIYNQTLNVMLEPTPKKKQSTVPRLPPPRYDGRMVNFTDHKPRGPSTPTFPLTSNQDEEELAKNQEKNKVAAAPFRTPAVVVARPRQKSILIQDGENRQGRAVSRDDQRISLLSSSSSSSSSSLSMSSEEWPQQKKAQPTRRKVTKKSASKPTTRACCTSPIVESLSERGEIRTNMFNERHESNDIIAKDDVHRPPATPIPAFYHQPTFSPLALIRMSPQATLQFDLMSSPTIQGWGESENVDNDGPFHDGAYCTLTLTSNSLQEYVAFKVKTTHAHRYLVRPNQGILAPLRVAGSAACSATLSVILVSSEVQRLLRLYDGRSGAISSLLDKFLVQASVVPEEIGREYINLQQELEENRNHNENRREPTTHPELTRMLTQWWGSPMLGANNRKQQLKLTVRHVVPASSSHEVLLEDHYGRDSEERDAAEFEENNDLSRNGPGNKGIVKRFAKQVLSWKPRMGSSANSANYFEDEENDTSPLHGLRIGRRLRLRATKE